MRALHVIGVDFKLRFRIDDGVLGEQQRLIGLFGVGLLGVLMNKDLAVENAVRMTVEDALVEFMTAAVGPGVVEDGMVIHVLAAAGDVQAVDGGFAAFVIQ